jgi:O-antigen ligase
MFGLIGVLTLLFVKSQRRTAIPAVILIGVATIGVLASGRGSIIQKYANKVLAEDRTLSQRTSGRSDMYVAFTRSIGQSPVWGFGPGSGSSMYTSGGETFVLHSLFLQIGMETGMIGLTALAAFYIGLFYRSWRHLKFTHEVVPLIGTLCCLADSLSHNSFNPMTGIFAGLAAADLSRFWRVQRVAMRRSPQVRVQRAEPHLLPAPTLPQGG